MGQGCRSSGLINASQLVYSGRCKLVSVHGYNEHAGNNSIVTIRDNTSASGKIVAKMVLPSLTYQFGAPPEHSQATSLEFDMHSVICHNGLYVEIAGGTANVTVEFA